MAIFTRTVKVTPTTPLVAGTTSAVAGTVPKPAPAARTQRVDPPEENVPTAFNHTTYRFSDENGKGYDADNKMIPTGTLTNHNREAQCVGSRIPDTNSHTIMLDLDLPATLVPSSTPGHHHLYIDMPITWDQYKTILKGFLEAGIIQQGFYDSSIRNGQSFLRMPGITKAPDAIPPK